MVHLFRALLGLIWGLWFGGVIALFVFAVALFKQLGREIAPQATQVLFPTFERYHLVLAALALLVCVGWRVIGKSRAASWVFAFFAIATCAATTSAIFLTPKIMELTRNGKAGTPEFWKTHGMSNLVYMTEAVALLVAGIIQLTAERGLRRASSPLPPPPHPSPAGSAASSNPASA
jgi:hypothetical protein